MIALEVRVALLVLLSGCIVGWTRLVVGRLKLGLPRLLGVVPIFLLTWMAPGLFDARRKEEVLLYDYTVMVYLWLVNFKTFALAFDRGSLAKNFDTSGTVVFAALVLLPVNVSGSEGKSSMGSKDLLLRALLKGFLTVGFAYASLNFWFFPFLRDICLTWLLYSTITMIMDAFAWILVMIYDTHLMSHFDRPWLSTSLSEFWSHRWNLVVGKLLKDVIYAPICQGSLYSLDAPKDKKRMPSPLRQVLAVEATFLASGMIHGVLIGYLTGSFGWKNMSFFVLHGILVLSERVFKDTIGKRKNVKAVMNNLPTPVCAACILGILHVTSHYLFWPEVLGLSKQVADSLLIG
ncbi:hypothetical protein BSKO_12077 [Bryopsis sp. KO-2023]|nr:hypothetical protein BSKO_12077 [Bryopsis sp. KO-2023]